ncbi:MAG: hypothetical protein R3F54_18410 [Alphaproteobacteria bacterium]
MVNARKDSQAARRAACLAAAALLWGAMLALPAAGALAEDMPNACPIDGCEVTIVGVQKAGDELELTYEANFTPDVSKNHIHAWWGENYTVEQVGRNAETVHGVTQGRWHRHDDYPTYVTKEAVSTSVRDGATTICVSPADRDHNILDVSIYHCVDVSGYF